MSAAGSPSLPSVGNTLWALTRVERATHGTGNVAGRAEIRAGHGPALLPTVPLKAAFPARGTRGRP